MHEITQCFSIQHTALGFVAEICSQKQLSQQKQTTGSREIGKTENNSGIT